MSMATLENLPIKIFADGADLEGIIDLYRKPYIKGLTTNPTLMRKVGVTDYEVFARSVLKSVTDKPISFEVFSDDFPEMRRQALKDSGLAGQRLRQDPDYQHQGGIRALPDRGPGRRRREAKRNGDSDVGTGQGCCRGVAAGGARGGFGFCGPNCRYRGRSDADH
jgi:Transaldolase/Fructose-6-phosphate aldolase